MSGYEAKVLADSVASGVRLTTMLVTMPRIVLAEFNTHRVLSRNSASSRAIPVEKRIAAVLENPFVPEAFAANQKGMQAGEALDARAQETARAFWLAASTAACELAARLAAAGVHKQWANRLIEPYCWHTVIVSATEWENFFALRCSPEAQPEIRRAAELMREAMALSAPRELEPGAWHLPLTGFDGDEHLGPQDLVRVSVARCARVSYLTHDGRRDVDADLALYDRLRASGHMSPFEHAAFVQSPLFLPGFVGNFRTPWIQHRKTLPGEAVFGGAAR
jgi:thymidylate synthase ThyX